MNKKVIFIILVFMSLFSVASCSCSKNNETEANISNTNNSNSSNTNDDSNTSETAYVAAIPNTFIFQEKEYFEDRENKDTNFIVFLGYLINFKDLDKWKEFDNNPDLLYAFDYGNSTYRLDYENKLTNRFEIFYNGTDFENLALKDITNELLVFTLGG